MDVRLRRIIASDVASKVRDWLEEHFDVMQKQDKKKINDPLEIVEDRMEKEIFHALEEQR